MLLRRVRRPLSAVFVAAALLAAPARAADLLVAAELADFRLLHAGAQAWQENTGHRVLWLPLVGAPHGGPDSTGLADLFLLPASAVMPLFREGVVRPVQAPAEGGADAFGVLLAGLLSAGRGGGMVALPFSASFPVLRYRRDYASAADIDIVAEPGWAQLAGYAARLADPVAGVHGFCPPGIAGNPAVVRAVVAAHGGGWLNGSGEPAFGSQRWRSAAEFYARMLAASGPPNAAYLDGARSAALAAQGKCGMWLAAAGSAHGAEVGALPVPGALAWVMPSLLALAVHAESERPALAAEFARWASSPEFAAHAGQNWVRISALPGKPEDERRAVLAEMAQSVTGALGTRPADAAQLRWDALDARLAPGLARLINGEISAARALASGAGAK